MIALMSRWKLADGFPKSLEAAVDELVQAVKRDEPDTMVFCTALPGKHPPIGPPPEYAIAEDLEPPPPQDELVFFEVYADAAAYQKHLLGAAKEFRHRQRHFFVTPWQGHPRPDVTLLDPIALVTRPQPT